MTEQCHEQGNTLGPAHGLEAVDRAREAVKDTFAPSRSHLGDVVDPSAGAAQSNLSCVRSSSSVPWPPAFAARSLPLGKNFDTES